MLFNVKSLMQIQKNKGKGHSFMDLGATIVKEEFIGENWKFKV